jgi:UDPglucose 6-dehydrogenase
MRVTIIGAGYVGLTTGACLSELGHDVICVDIDKERIARLKAGVFPFREAGLDEIMIRNMACRRLRFSDHLASAVRGRDIVMVAVGTPKGVRGEADLAFVRQAAQSFAPFLSPRTVVTLKSTVAVGTAREVREIIAEERGALDFWVTSNPEFLREGSAVSDFLTPDRIVIGADDRDAGERLIKLYRPLLDRGVPLVETGTADAELIKYAANAFLALKIGFTNDVADLCEVTEGDINSVAKGIGLDPRIGTAFLKPGPGYGGSCFPKDTEAFAWIGRALNAPQPLIEALIARNDYRKRHIAERVLKEIAGISGAQVAVLGAAFKANTDDVRESAALQIVPALQKANVGVKMFDPWASGNAAPLLPSTTWAEDPYDAAEGADLLLILTEWEMFRSLDPARLAEALRRPVVFDCRNLFDPEQMALYGFRYVSLGRASVPRERRWRSNPLPNNRQKAASPSA